VKKEDASIDHYVTRKALDGLYLIIGEEEKKIRATRSAPAATSCARCSAPSAELAPARSRSAFQESRGMAYNDFNMDNQWLPFTPNRSFRKDPRVFVAADGMHFTTHDGRQVIDGISSLWCVGAGHNRKPINEAIKKQLDTLDYATAFQASNDKAFKAAEMIAAMAPGDLNKVLFCNSGSEAADTSLKVALAYHRARGEGHRTSSSAARRATTASASAA
jgi:4-aminobutyrate aminotransferase-like enzyme